MMKKNGSLPKVAALSVLCVLPFLLSGCLAFLLGGAAAYEASPDSAKTVYDAPYARAYDASFAVAKTIVGIFEMDDKYSGWIKVTSDNNNIAIHVVRLTPKTTQVIVSVRKFVTPRPQVAQDILNKISAKLR